MITKVWNIIKSGIISDKKFVDKTLSFEKNKQFIKCMQGEFVYSPDRFAISLVSPHSKVLSCGCGAGREVNFLVKERFCDVTAIDHSENIIKLSKNQEPKAKYFTRSFVNYISEDKFDFIICLWNTINYLPSKENRIKFIESCYENLKEKGVLIIRSDTRDKNFSTFINSLLSKGRFYFKEKEIFEWFKNTEFKFRIININNTNIILASKENIFR